MDIHSQTGNLQDGVKPFGGDQPAPTAIKARILLLVPTTTYRIGDFLSSAARLGIEVTVGSDQQHVLEEFSDSGTLTVDFDNTELGQSQIIDFSRQYPLQAIVGIDDETTLIAAMSAQALGLRGNDPDAVEATRNKYQFRTRLANCGLNAPQFSLVAFDDDFTEDDFIGDDPFNTAGQFSYPVVLKPLALSASRGVIRADTPEEFKAAFKRIKLIIRQSEISAELAGHILVENYIPGIEVALEGILENGNLRLLALFDKPDPLIGPYFEETIYVTPSRLSVQTQDEIIATVANAVSHLGLREGAIHAELRINDDGVWPIEVATRSIGGNCARALRFGLSGNLEDVILRSATRADDEEKPAITVPKNSAAGVMMIPIPMAGRLCQVDGIDAARAVAGIEDVTINIPLGQTLVPVPKGNKYLGFIFARSKTPEDVEANLRKAHALLRFSIETNPESD